MDNIRKIILPLIVTFCLNAFSFAQKPDSWRGLKLDVSTPDDAIGKLGNPKKDKTGQKLRTVIGDWINKDLRYRKMEWKNLGGIKKAKLYFNEGLLRAIEIEPREKINPNSLSEAYGIQFLPKVSGLDVAFNPNAYGRDYEGRSYPKQYPLVYHIIGVSDNSFISALVQQGTFSHFGKTIGGVQDDGFSFPGKVPHILLISRTLEDTKGLDVLK